MKVQLVGVSAIALCVIMVGAALLTAPAAEVSAQNQLSSESSLEPLWPAAISSAYQLGSWCSIDCGDDGTTDYSVYLDFYTLSTCACTCANRCGTECYSSTAICGGS